VCVSITQAERRVDAVFGDQGAIMAELPNFLREFGHLVELSRVIFDGLLEIKGYGPKIDAGLRIVSKLAEDFIGCFAPGFTSF
jgi:hypothetical protein